MRDPLRTFSLIAAICTIVGCVNHPRDDQSAAIGSSSQPIVALSEAGSADGPRDAQPALPIVFRLECYQIKLPLGSVSRNDALWKRMNEQCVDVATYDLLYKNGLRVGTAPYSEWGYVNTLIQQNPGTASKTATISDELKNLPLEIKKHIAYQTIFHFDADNSAVGRTFDRCENLINLSFQKIPRKPGHVRLALAPVVRSERKRLEYTVLNDELEFSFKLPEMYYENLVVDLAAGSFMIVAPSPEATWPSSLGHAFLIHDEEAEQYEQVLVIVAQPLIDDAARAK